MCKAQQSSHGTLSHCCTELFDKNAWPTQTVTSPENYTILFCVSLVLLLIRVGLWKCVYLPKRGHSLVASIDLRYWVLILWDQYVTMMIAAVFAGLMTNYMKLLVGSPRPCYYALQLFSSVHITDREKLESESTLVSTSSVFSCLLYNIPCYLKARRIPLSYLVTLHPRPLSCQWCVCFSWRTYSTSGIISQRSLLASRS